MKEAVLSEKDSYRYEKSTQKTKCLSKGGENNI